MTWAFGIKQAAIYRNPLIFLCSFRLTHRNNYCSQTLVFPYNRVMLFSPTLLITRFRYHLILKSFLAIALFVPLFSSGIVLAEQTPEPDSSAVDETSDTSDPTNNAVGSRLDILVGQVNSAHDYVSSGLETTAKSLDEFFAEDTAYEDSTRTYLRLGLDSVLREREGFGFSGGLRLKLHLPRTKKRLRLLIESDDQRSESENLENKPTDVAQRSDYSLAIEKDVSGANKWNLRPSLGIKLHSRIDTFFRLRSHRYFSYNDWLMRVSHHAAWFDSRGFEANTGLALDHPLSKNLLFRYSPTLSWQEEEMFRRITQGFSVYQEIDSRQKMAYQIIAEADDDWNEWRAKRYDALIRYRRGLYKKWLFGEVIPQLIFLKETGFHNDPIITFRLEVVFGERYRQL